MHSSCLLRFCILASLLVSDTLLFAEDWPQWLGPKRDAIWRESGIIEKFPANGLPIRWRTKIGAGYSGPIVANGRVYVTDRPLAQDTATPADPFERGSVRGGERVVCLSEADAHRRCHHAYESGYPIG